MSKNIHLPEWVPQVGKGAKILIVGARGGIGRAVIELLMKGPSCTMGAHRASSPPASRAGAGGHVLIDLKMPLVSDEDCCSLVNSFAEQADGIDGLVALCGGIAKTDHWKNLTEAEWKSDMNLNLDIPFFLSRAAMKQMQASGGRIILTGTESALHGGGPTSFAYGIAKRGTECMVQGLAREGAQYNVLVNGIRPGFIKSGFHQRWQHKGDDDLAARADLVPLKRGGEPAEVAALIVYLLSGWAQFITGQMFAITGGDWL